MAQPDQLIRLVDNLQLFSVKRGYQEWRRQQLWQPLQHGSILFNRLHSRHCLPRSGGRIAYDARQAVQIPVSLL